MAYPHAGLPLLTDLTLTSGSLGFARSILPLHAEHWRTWEIDEIKTGIALSNRMKGRPDGENADRHGTYTTGHFWQPLGIQSVG